MCNADLSSYSAQCVAGVLKKFLRELPDPVIPVQFYDRFIEASSEYYIYMYKQIYKMLCIMLCAINREDLLASCVYLIYLFILIYFLMFRYEERRTVCSTFGTARLGTSRTSP